MRWPILSRTTAATTATAVAGALLTDPGSRWYRRLDLPRWQPAPSTFPLVWLPLYVDIAVCSAIALDRLSADPARRGERRQYRGVLGTNLALNAGWTLLFFRARRPWLAAAECAVLTVSSADLTFRTAHADRRAGLALAPYPLWCAFATVLTVAIARRNPRA
ncbi:MAG TPA: TspO/MBR family protein [Actinomycetales bacterium]|jgi:tryptophan-rich sensory protein